MQIIALYSIKGGVGKTATAVNLAYLASLEGSTLLWDLDPQGSASLYYRIRPSKKLKMAKMMRGGKHVSQHIRGTDYEQLEMMPSKLSYRNLDLILEKQKRPVKRLKQLLQPLRQEYEFIFLDCPPNITLVSENIFNAADLILVPIIPTTLSSMTYEKLLKFFEKHSFETTKIWAFFSMVERRKKLHTELMQNMSKQYGKFLTTTIPYLSEVERMGLYREPLTHRYPNSRSAFAYQHLWQELKKVWLKSRMRIQGGESCLVTDR